MTTTAHAVAPEDIMAWLDGELSAAEAETVSLHVAGCAECAALADDLRNTSQSLARWTVPVIPASLEEFITKATDGREKSYRPIRAPHRNWKVWAIGGGGLAGIFATLLIVAVWNRSQPRPLMAEAETMTRANEHAESKQLDRLEQFAKIFAPPPASQPLYEQMGKSKQADRYQGTINATLAQPPAVKTPPRADRYSGGGLEQLGDGPLAGGPKQLGNGTLPTPMIARSVSLTIQVKNVETARASLDQILALHHGYSAQLNADTAENSARSLRASLRIPAPELAAGVADIKTLGRIQNEIQSGEEVTQQHEDLVARLTTSRGTEERLRAILQQRTGKVSDVLEVEEEIARVRGEIESMEAEQKTLEHRVDFATIDIQFTEEYKAQLNSPDNSALTRIHNAFVAGYHNATDTLLGFLLFFEEYGPTILIWLVILAVPVLLAWRRYRRVRSIV